jgi:hypothetical protein
MGIGILTCHCDFELLHLLSFRAKREIFFYERQDFSSLRSLK